jgi:translation initiation factor IF-2
MQTVPRGNTYLLFVVVSVNVIFADVGEITKTDESIATVTPGTTIIAFNTAATFAAVEDARQLNIPIEYYNIICDAIGSDEMCMQEVLSPTPQGEYVESALVQEVFIIGGTGNITGSRFLDGIIKKGSNARALRGDKILVESRVKKLRNFKLYKLLN